MKRKQITAILLAITTISLTSCGVKPMGSEETTVENKDTQAQIQTQGQNQSNGQNGDNKAGVNYKNDDENVDLRSADSKKIVSDMALNEKVEGAFANYETLKVLEFGKQINNSIWALSENIMFELQKDKEKENIVFSPFALVNDIAILNEGAVGDAKDATNTILNLNVAQENTTSSEGESSEENKEVIKGNGELSGTMAPLVKLFNNKFTDENGNPNRNGMSLSTALLVQKGMTVNEKFLQKITDSYAAEAFNVDFNNKDEVKNLVNAWIKERSKGFIDAKTEVVDGTTFDIVNLFSINTKWYDSYTDGGEMDFTTSKGETKKVPSMVKKDYTTHIETTDKYVAYVDRLKSGGDVWFFIPNEGKSIDEITMKSIKETVSKDLSALEHVNVSVTIPQFKIANEEINLKNALEQAGYKRLLAGDYSNIANGIKLDSIKQQYSFIVDTIGVRNGAVTDTQQNGQNSRKDFEKVELKFNKPFIMVIESYNYPQYIIKVGNPN